MESIGIDSRAKAEAMQNQSQRNTLAIMLAIALTCLIVVLIWPAMMGMVSVIGGLILLVLFTTMLRANRLIKRYIQESL